MVRSRLDPTKRVLHITEAMGGGVASALFDYLRSTPELEHHLLYVSRAETSALGAQWKELFTSVQELPQGQLNRIRKVRSRIKELKPGVVHSHSSFAGFYARLAAAKSASLRQVHTPHCYAFERLDLKRPLRLALRLIEWTLSFNTTVLAGCSPRETALGARRFLSPQRSYLPNLAPELPIRQQTADSVSVRTEVLRVTGAGRLGAQKDPELFISAIQQLRQAGNRVVASWVGGGDPVLVDRLNRAGVQVTGWLPRPEALERLADNDVYLHTAAWEGFPLAVLEASALHLATVVRDIAAFQGLGLPAKITESSELPGLWEQLRDPIFRAELVAQTRYALRSNTRSAQRQALLEAYAIEAESGLTGSAEPTSTEARSVAHSGGSR
ncbi:glycosyltransferase [Psychromicrobium lacuslunae]|uniref:glycosyltransferase n=1 Tax=Psychromicrobium lacuslunae TaxID=1618207 RepID=UPI00069637A4|nr:glycosyltransferase [Psychromicrobium lacuslunae]